MEVLDIGIMKIGILEILIAILALMLVVVITNICSLVILSKGNKNKNITQTTSVPTGAVGADVTNDLELVAVITAAIAAQEGTSTDSFVVRSIRRRPSNAWK